MSAGVLEVGDQLLASHQPPVTSQTAVRKKTLASGLDEAVAQNGNAEGVTAAGGAGLYNLSNGQPAQPQTVDEIHPNGRRNPPKR